MKKKLNSSSKRKWVLNGVLAFGAVALLTTGFATWVVGVNNVVKDSDVTVTVDTAENKTLFFTMELDTANMTGFETYEKAGNVIDLKEKTTTNPSKYIRIEGNDAIKDNTQPLRLKTKSMSFVVGKSFFDENKITGIEYSLPRAQIGGEGPTYEENVKLVATNNATGREPAENLTYLDIDSAEVKFTHEITKNDISGSSVGEFKITNDGSKYTFTLNTQKEIQFKWGTYFSNVTPSEYYNGKVDEIVEGTAEEVLMKKDDYASKAVDELNAMHTALDGKKIKLRAKLITVSTKS